MSLTPEAIEMMFGEGAEDRGNGRIVIEPFKRPPKHQTPRLNWIQRRVSGKTVNHLDREAIALNAYIDQQDSLMEGVKAKIGEYNEAFAEKDAKINEADETMNKWLSEENEELTKLRRELNSVKDLNTALKQENAQYRVQLGMRVGPISIPARNREKPNPDDSEASQSVENVRSA